MGADSAERISGLKRAARRAYQDPKAQEEARAALDEANRLAPDDPEILLAMGQLLYRDACRQRSRQLELPPGDEAHKAKFEFVRLHRECLIRLKRAFELGLDGYSDIPRIVTSNHFHLDDVDRAIGQMMIEQVLADEPGGRACRHYHRAVFMLNFDRDRPGAAEELEKALAIERHPRPLVMRGNLSSRVGDFEEALRDFDEAVTLAPADPVALSARARGRMRMDDAAGAAEDFAKAFAIEPPETYEPWVELAEASSRAGALEQAIAAYGRALEFGGNCVVSLRRALAREKAGDITGALQDLDLAAAAPGLKDQVAKARQRLAAG